MRRAMDLRAVLAVNFFLEAFPPQLFKDMIKFTNEVGGVEGNLSRDFYRFIGLHIAMSLYPMVGERRDFWAVQDREFSLHRTMKFGDYLS